MKLSEKFPGMYKVLVPISFNIGTFIHICMWMIWLIFIYMNISVEIYRKLRNPEPFLPAHGEMTEGKHVLRLTEMNLCSEYHFGNMERAGQKVKRRLALALEVAIWMGSFSICLNLHQSSSTLMLCPCSLDLLMCTAP